MEVIKLNSTIDTILNRRSVRAYKPDQISEDVLDTILKAGRFAPTAMGQQSYHFTVVQNSEVLEKINTIAKNLYANSSNPHMKKRAAEEGFSIFYHAPTYIIVSGEDSALAPKEDCTLATGNMFIAAASLGVSSVWVHAINSIKATEEGAKLLKEIGIPEGYTPVSSAAFGYIAGENPQPRERREGTVNFVR